NQNNKFSHVQTMNVNALYILHGLEKLGKTVSAQLVRHENAMVLSEYTKKEAMKKAAQEKRTVRDEEYVFAGVDVNVLWRVMNDVDRWPEWQYDLRTAHKNTVLIYDGTEIERVWADGSVSKSIVDMAWEPSGIVERIVNTSFGVDAKVSFHCNVMYESPWPEPIGVKIGQQLEVTGILPFSKEKESIDSRFGSRFEMVARMAAHRALEVQKIDKTLAAFIPNTLAKEISIRERKTKEKAPPACGPVGKLK
ncbi:hypothetical protein HDU93_007654, partial [Gonapodya sp. JEL0774]